jgi:hypothetical protein
MKRIAGSTVIPVIDIEGYVIRGYAPDEIKRAVDQSRKAAR